MTPAAAIHHVELWVPQLASARPRWAWLLGALGWGAFQDWSDGCSWRAPDGTYLVIEQSPDLRGTAHDRHRPGLNHIAFGTTKSSVDSVAEGAQAHGWTLLFPDRHPHAGGVEHYAAYLTDLDGYEVEVVATRAAA